MAAMKRYLILCAFAASAASRGASAPPPQLVEVKQPGAGAPVLVKAPVLPRRLSDQERLELRRQLQQFNSQYRKQS
jgi:hypothetical protein